MKECKTIEITQGKITMSNWMALTSLVLIILSNLILVNTVFVNAQNDIKINQEKVDLCHTNLEMQNKIINDHEKRIITIETHYNYIRNQLDKIDKKLG